MNGVNNTAQSRSEPVTPAASGQAAIGAVRAAMGGFCAMALAMGIGRFFYTPVLPPMLEAGRLNAAEAGLAAGANFLGYLLGALLASAAFFSTHRYRWMVSALALCTFATLLSGGWAGFAAFSAVRFMAGFASAFSMIFISAIVLRIFQEQDRGGLIAVHFAGVGFGIVLSSAIVPMAVNAGFGWQAMWLMAGLCAAMLLAALLVLLPGSAAGHEHPQAAVPASGGGKQASFSAAFWALLTGYGFFGFGYSVSATFINTIAKADPALLPAEPWVWFSVGLAGIPSIWFWNRLASRFGLAYTYSFACFVEAAGILLLLWHQTPLILIISGITLGGTFVAVTALGLAKGRSMTPQAPATALALMTAAFGLGQMAGPVMAGFVFERTASFAPALAVAVAALAATVVLTLLSKRLELA